MHNDATLMLFITSTPITSSLKGILGPLILSAANNPHIDAFKTAINYNLRAIPLLYSDSYDPYLNTYSEGGAEVTGIFNHRLREAPADREHHPWVRVRDCIQEEPALSNDILKIWRRLEFKLGELEHQCKVDMTGHVYWMYRAESPSWACAASAFKAGIAPLGGRIYEIPDSDQKEMTEDVGSADITGISHEEQFEQASLVISHTADIARNGITLTIQLRNRIISIIYKVDRRIRYRVHWAGQRASRATWRYGEDNVDGKRGIWSIGMAELRDQPANQRGRDNTAYRRQTPWPRGAPEEESVAPETKATGLEALVDKGIVVGDGKTSLGIMTTYLPSPAFQGPRTLSTIETMPPEEDPYAVPSSEPDMEQENPPNARLSNKRRPAVKEKMDKIYRFQSAVDQSMVFLRDNATNAEELSIDNEDLKKKLALAEERQQKYFDFWRSAEEEPMR
ncbi:hypothetical protein FMUND_7244 [Fusarium mundagurra]|uniref:Uncharacterized protein n=1 Tax=Fusarium mundagurra TaxID=1567541 RepID=A0A8H6DFI4_9HYPO|nr:hypothetical protein FMUND_7244 [Fusarium mundagurra]